MQETLRFQVSCTIGKHQNECHGLTPGLKFEFPERHSPQQCTPLEDLLAVAAGVLERIPRLLSLQSVVLDQLTRYWHCVCECDTSRSVDLNTLEGRWRRLTGARLPQRLLTR